MVFPPAGGVLYFLHYVVAIFLRLGARLHAAAQFGQDRLVEIEQALRVRS